MAVQSTHLDGRPPTGPGRRARPASDWLGWAALVALALWAAAPIIYLSLKASSRSQSLTGGESLFPLDQLQYLAWIRSSGEHFLAANGFALGDGGHVYLQPMFLLSGLLWRAGLSIALSYLLWMPIAVGILFFGFRQYTRLVLHTPGARLAALLLAIFFVTPVDPLVGWTVGSGGLETFAGELSPTGALYGYFPAVIATGLMPLFVLGLERITETERRQPGRSARWYITLTAAGGVIVSWLHPWQGETLLLIIGALLVRARLRKSHWPLLVPAAATAIPLVYYVALSKLDLAWRIGQSQSTVGKPNVLLLGLALAPLLVFTPTGAGRWRLDTQDLILLVWPLAALVVYVVSPGYSLHSLEGLSLPLAVLATRGWQELRLPTWLAAVAITVATVPGLIFNVHLFHDGVRANSQGLLFDRDETRALSYIEHAPDPGGVLPSLRIAAAVPAYTGRRTWIGHPGWTPDYALRAETVSKLFADQLSAAAGRRLLAQVGARYILADCEPSFDPAWLRSLLTAERRFGCVTVYELSRPARPASL